MKIPINVPYSDAEKKRIEGEEKSWAATKLVILGLVALGAALALLVFMSQCQLTPLP